MTRGHLVIGAGYVGGSLARELARRAEPVYVTRRAPSRADELAGPVRAIVFDTGAGVLTPPPDFPEVDELDVYCLLTPTALATAEARRWLFEWLDRLPVRRAVLSSSTGIYGEQAGGIVTAETPIAPVGERERRLHDIEQAWLGRARSLVVRFAGLYGPGRVIGLQAVRDGALLPGQASTWLNLLHRDDAAALLIAAAGSPHSAPIEVGSDGMPIARGDYYAELARQLGAPAPRFAEPADDSTRGKAVDADSTRQRLGWMPRQRDFRRALNEALRAGAAG